MSCRIWFLVLKTKIFLILLLVFSSYWQNFYFALSRTSSYTPVLDNQYSYLYYTLCHIRFCKTRYPRYLFFLYAHSLLFLHCKSNMMFHHKENDLCFIFSTENLNEWINMFLPFFMKILYYLVGMFVFSGRLFNYIYIYNIFLFMFRNILDWFVNLIWQNYLTSSFYVFILPKERILDCIHVTMTTFTKIYSANFWCLNSV